MQEMRDTSLISGSGRSPGGEHGNPLQHLPIESHGQRSLEGYSPQGHTESEVAEATKHVGFLYDKEEKGNSLKLSCRKPRVPSNISACDFF